MTETFESSAIDLTPDDRQAADQPEPTVVVGEQIPGWLRAWLDSQPWHAEPLDSIPALVDYARNAEWTTSNAARTRRLIWLYAVAAPARIAPWLILRIWKGVAAPAFAGKLPSIRDARDIDGPRNRIAATAYSTASITARVAESAPRTGVALLIGWCGANAAGWPEWVTVAYWWQQIAELWAHITASTGSATHSAAPTAHQVTSAIGQLLFIAGVIAIYVVVRLLKNKGSES